MIRTLYFFFVFSVVCLCLFPRTSFADDEKVIEEQLAEVGSIAQSEVIVVQRKYTRKVWRHELMPVLFGGIPFGTIRRTMFGGAGYVLHFSDHFAWEALNFLYSKHFFTNFTDEINDNNPAPDVKPDFQKLILIATTGLQWTPFYGKFSTFSRWIAYLEPFFSIGAGLTKTETKSYASIAPGIGFRVFFREWVSMRVELKDYMYIEEVINRQNGNKENKFRNNYAVMLSLSFWLPKMPS